MPLPADPHCNITLPSDLDFPPSHQLPQAFPRMNRHQFLLMVQDVEMPKFDPSHAMKIAALLQGYIDRLESPRPLSPLSPFPNSPCSPSTGVLSEIFPSTVLISCAKE